MALRHAPLRQLVLSLGGGNETAGFSLYCRQRSHRVAAADGEMRANRNGIHTLLLSAIV